MSAILLTRRHWMFAAAAAVAWRSDAPPSPRVYRLADWKSAEGLGVLKDAFANLDAAALVEKAPGRYPIDGDRMYLTVSEARTRDPATAEFEAHRKYIDVQYLIRGAEMIGTRPAAELKSVKPYDPATDAEMFARPTDYRRFVLKPGDFVVFFPGQAHLPGCHPAGVTAYKKAVVKVLASSL